MSYIADEEAYDAISFVPNKDIKFLGFSVYAVHTPENQDFKCLYKLKIGSESWPEKMQEFSQGEVDNKMCDIILPAQVPVAKHKPIIIGVRFISGDSFFCTTLLGYGGEDYMNLRTNDERAFQVVDTEDCTKGETDYTFG